MADLLDGVLMMGKKDTAKAVLEDNDTAVIDDSHVNAIV